MPFELNDPEKKITSTDLKRFIDGLVTKFSPDEELLKMCAMVVMFSDFPKYSKTLSKNNKLKASLKKISDTTNTQLKKVFEKIKDVPQKVKDKPLAFALAQQHSMELMDRIKLMAVMLLAMKSDTEGEREANEMMKQLHKLYSKVDKVLFDSTGKHLFEGFGESLANGLKAMASSIWSVVKAIMAPILRVCMAVLKAIWRLIEPIIGVIQGVYEKARISKIAGIIGSADLILRLFSCTALGAMSMQVMGACVICEAAFKARDVSTIGSELASVADMIVPGGVKDSDEQ